MNIPRYIGTLILVTTTEEAARINDGADCEDIYCEYYAVPYGTHTIGMRYEAVEVRYTGTRNVEYENEVAQGLRYDLRRGFDN